MHLQTSYCSHNLPFIQHSFIHSSLLRFFWKNVISRLRSEDFAKKLKIFLHVIGRMGSCASQKETANQVTSLWHGSEGNCVHLSRWPGSPQNHTAENGVKRVMKLSQNIWEGNAHNLSPTVAMAMWRCEHVLTFSFQVHTTDLQSENLPK